MFSPDDSRVVYTMVMPGLKWDSWQVPVLGGSPQPFLANASGLNWVDDHHLVYSSIKSGLHIVIVTSDQSQTDTKEICFPASEGGMSRKALPSRLMASYIITAMGLNRATIWMRDAAGDRPPTDSGYTIDRR